MSPRVLRILLPLLVLLTSGFALYHLFLAGMSLRLRSYPFALFYLVMGIGGFAIATALRGLWKRMRQGTATSTQA